MTHVLRTDTWCGLGSRCSGHSVQNIGQIGVLRAPLGIAVTQLFNRGDID